MNFELNNRRSIHVFGNPIMQSWYDLFFINEILTEPTHVFKHIVELGTYRGGLTVFLGLHALTRGIDVTTFDIRPEPYKPPYTTYKELLPITYHNLNVFSEEAKNIVREKAKDGRMFIFLDGGEKPMDFETYAPIVEANDVVMIHDKNREIFDHEVKPIAKANGLEPFYQEEADKVGADIYCFIKKWARRAKP